MHLKFDDIVDHPEVGLQNRGCSEIFPGFSSKCTVKSEIFREFYLGEVDFPGLKVVFSRDFPVLETLVGSDDRILCSSTRMHTSCVCCHSGEPSVDSLWDTVVVVCVCVLNSVPMYMGHMELFTVNGTLVGLVCCSVCRIQISDVEIAVLAVAVNVAAKWQSMMLIEVSWWYIRVS